MKQKNQESQQQLKVESYEFEPIKGYPMLNWKGKRPFTSTQYFPSQLKESYGKPGPDGWMNKLFWGDNLQVMSHLLKEFRGKVRLIYIDPPFDSNADYKAKVTVKSAIVKTDSLAFEEKQYGDIWANDEYLQFIYDRLILMRELLANNGSIYLHCDYRKSHHIRCIMDEVFGAENLKNEIVWCYTAPSNISSNFPRKHDNIFFYTKSDSAIFNVDDIRVPYSEESLSRANRNVIKKGGTIFDGVKLNIAGKVPEDWWADINPASRYPNEHLGYPTQKSEKLLERIIKASSNEGDLVFDCFCGSGTTATVATKLKRRFLAADINVGAIFTTTKRLVSTEANFEIHNVNNYDLFRNPVEAKELLIQALEITKIHNSIFDGEKDGRMVKIMPVNRIASKSDLNDLFTGLDRKSFEKRQKEHPNKPVEKILLICMGHEPDLKAHLEREVEYKLDIEIVDILRDKKDLQFKRESETKIKVKKDRLVIEKFFPMNLLQKLSLQKEKVSEWRELVESVLIDWNYDGAVLEPQVIDIPEKDELVKGEYDIPKDAGTIRVKITDLLAESLEVEVSRD